MTLLEAIEARHSVRKYKDEPIPEEILTTLLDRIREINEEAGLHTRDRRAQGLQRPDGLRVLLWCEELSGDGRKEG